MEPLRADLEEDEFENDFPADDEERDAMMMLLAETAGRNPAARFEDPNALGERTEDWTYDWGFHVNTYRQVAISSPLPDSMPDIYASTHWWAYAKEVYPADSRVDYHVPGIVNQLAPQQRLIYDTVIQHYDSQAPHQLLLNIDGRAGTGKSFIIQVLSSHLQSRTEHEVIIRAAPTGAASFGIRGSTLYALLKLPVNQSIQTLGSGAAQALQSRLSHLKYLIIDEKSMVSPKTLHYVDRRLRQAFNTERLFGGVSILLFGDFWQLPPVKDKALFFQPPAFPLQIAPQHFATEMDDGCINPNRPPRAEDALPAPDREAQPVPNGDAQPASNDGVQPAPDGDARPALDGDAQPAQGAKATSTGYISDEDWHGIHAYRAFSQSIELTIQQRQDPAQVAFASALEGLRNSAVTVQHWETLSSRCKVCSSFAKGFPLSAIEIPH